jgi:hypothetical protein
MGKFLLFLLAILILIPRLMRLLVPRRPPADDQARRPRETRQEDRLRDLTRQDISDADYEEIPPEE